MTDKNNQNNLFEELCAGYVLRALEPEERKQFEEMLRNASEEQAQLFHNMQSAANQLSFTMERTEPSDKVKKELMEKIQAEAKQESGDKDNATDRQPDNKTGILSDNQKFAIVASIALFIITLSLILYSFNLSSQLNSKQKIIEQQQARISELKSEVEQKEELLAVLESREVDLVIMSGLEVNPDGYGKIIWDPAQRRALLQVSNLPPVPRDKDYQLWIIKNNKPVSAGVFSVTDPQKDSFFKIEELSVTDDESANAFAVTMEPKGGVPQPTGDMYLLGDINKNRQR